MWLQLALTAVLASQVLSQVTAPREQNCLLNSETGCSFARAPEYMIIAPRRIRPQQVFQVFASILHMKKYQEYVHVHVSIIRDDEEYAGTVLRFDRPSTRIMQLRMPASAQEGHYKLRVEGRLQESATGNIWQNETDIELYNKQASLFMQMSKPLYRQGQTVHFRVIPILPNMMPKYGSMIIYIDDPSGMPVRRWQGLQTNAGGIVSQSFELSDQPNYGIWNIRVLAFGHTYRHPFVVEEFWEPRFDVNVSVPPYLMIMKDINSKIKGVVLANHTSGRPCKGNASISVFFRPREEVWNQTQGWMKPYNDAMNAQGRWSFGVPLSKPGYMPVTEVPVRDYHMYFPYHYKFIDYFDGRIDFSYTLRQLLEVAVQYTKGRADDIISRDKVVETLVGSEFVFFLNVTDWYSGLNRTGWAGTILFDNKIKIKFVGGAVRTFKPNSIMKVQVAVSKYDGTPVSGGAVTVTDAISSDGKQINRQLSGPRTQSLKKGIAEFEYTIGANAESMTLTATYDDGGKTYQGGQAVYQNPEFEKRDVEPVTLHAWRYYSPSNSYITIMTSTDYPKVDNEFKCRTEEGGGGQMPCFTAEEGDCFTVAEKCNGVIDGCPSDGADEWGCPEEEMVETHESPLDRVSRVMRFYDNSSWAWQEIFVKPDGRVDFRVDVPKYPLSWVINGISVSRDLGLGIMKHPVRYDAARYMYIQVEHPKHIIRGEQIGVRVTVFNYWYDDDYLE
ncbi:CD109 antigen, partial [Elysia marginata]